jgi:hypothetical protein
VVKVHVLEVNALACFQRSILARDS